MRIRVAIIESGELVESVLVIPGISPQLVNWFNTFRIYFHTYSFLVHLCVRRQV